MADLKISELNALAGSALVSGDLVAVVDNSASETKKLTVGDLVANGVTLISDDTIPGAKILFGAGDVATAAVADSAITTAKLANDGVTAAKLADESTVDLVTTLPASGAFTGQLALDTDDNSLYCWSGSAWLSLKAAGSINTVTVARSALLTSPRPQAVAVSRLQLSLMTRLQPINLWPVLLGLVERLRLERLMAAIFRLRQLAPKAVWLSMAKDSAWTPTPLRWITM